VKKAEKSSQQFHCDQCGHNSVNVWPQFPTVPKQATTDFKEISVKKDRKVLKPEGVRGKENLCTKVYGSAEGKMEVSNSPVVKETVAKENKQEPVVAKQPEPVKVAPKEPEQKKKETKVEPPKAEAVVKVTEPVAKIEPVVAKQPELVVQAAKVEEPIAKAPVAKVEPIVAKAPEPVAKEITISKRSKNRTIANLQRMHLQESSYLLIVSGKQFLQQSSMRQPPKSQQSQNLLLNQSLSQLKLQNLSKYQSQLLPNPLPRKPPKQKNNLNPNLLKVFSHNALHITNN
jgi:hypothetical protein